MFVAKYPQIEAAYKKYNLLLFVDGTQDFGGSIDGKMMCSLGNPVATTFFAEISRLEKENMSQKTVKYKQYVLSRLL